MIKNLDSEAVEVINLDQIEDIIIITVISFLLILALNVILV